MKRSLLLLLPVLVIVLAACARDAGGGNGMRTVAVRMYDDMSYAPDALEFVAGDTIKFEVSNEGQVRHEFFIGDTAAHEEHAADMREGGHSEDSHADPASVSVEPAATGMLTYTFQEAGELLVGCHEPGHYEAGMVAPITVHP